MQEGGRPPCDAAGSALGVTTVQLGTTALKLTQTVHFPRMSVQIFSDENVTGDRSTENCGFLFSPPEVTGRSSVLRMSQKENVPPKSTARAMKVSVFCLSEAGGGRVGSPRAPLSRRLAELAGCGVADMVAEDLGH